MNFLVTQSSPPVLVGPSEPTAAGNLPLTSSDMAVLYMPVSSLHVFDRPIHELAETIRRGMSRALVHYYPVAGRLAVSGADVQLTCTGDGVEFVAATASCTLEDLRFLDAPLVTPLDALVLRFGERARLSECPLLLMQVTEFACGGYVVGVTWNHVIADAFGMAQFLRAVGELARGLSAPSVVPVRHDPSLPEIPQLLAALGPPLDLKPVEFAYADVSIPWSFVKRIKAEFRGAGQRCSTFEVVAAAVWQCRTRAINADPGSLAPLVFTANMRKHAGAQDGYYGNCVALQMVVATCGAVANGDTAEVVRLIKHGKERIPDILGSYEPVLFSKELVGALNGYAPLFMTSWGGIGLEGVDFGGGGPARVMANKEMTWTPGCVPCLPCARKDGDGVNVLAFCVTEEHVDGFHAAVAALR